MFADQLRRAVEPSPTADLPKVSSLVWRAYARQEHSTTDNGTIGRVFLARLRFPHLIRERIIGAFRGSGYSPCASAGYLRRLTTEDREPTVMANLPTNENSRANTIRHRPGRITVVASFVLGLTPHSTQSLAAEASFKDFPYLIFCQYRGVDHAYYFSRLEPDGRAIYMTPDRQAASISLGGTAKWGAEIDRGEVRGIASIKRSSN